MNHRTLIAVFFAFVAYAGANSVIAQAQGTCTGDTFTGTYAFYEKGSSAAFPPASQNPALAPFWAGAFAPFITVGQVTMRPGGVGEGFYWIRAGSINGGSDPIPVTVAITEFDNNCTGKFTYSLQLPGLEQPTVVTERFILFDNGREFVTIPAEIANGVPYLTWIGQGHRDSKPAKALDVCGPHTVTGDYVMSVENMVQFTPELPIFSDVLLVRYHVSEGGDYTGTLYEKLGPNGNIVLPASGSIKVNSNCSYESTLNITVQDQPVSIDIRGVVLDQGKKLYGLAVDSRAIEFSFGQSERINE